jgi:methylphosphotriester-DNA--protein-cysteine methyltransferase
MFDTPESRWRALQTRNRLAASAFLYGVTTTRIYCRPACPSRLARQANIVFFDSATEAESAGFRPCRRCKPSKSDFEPKTAQHEKAVRKACNLIDAAGGRLTLDNLASSVGLSPRYLHGIFKNAMGVTPSVYAMRVRKGKTVRTSQCGDKPEEACTVNGALSSGMGHDRSEEESVLSGEISPSSWPPHVADFEVTKKMGFDRR